MQWLQGYQVDAEVVASVYTSLASVFPYVETWATNDADLLLIASATPLRHDLARERRALAGEPYRSALADTWGVAGAEGLYTGFVATPELARRLAAAGAPPNLDDRPVIEFGLARGVGAGSFTIEDLRKRVPPSERRPPGLDGLDWRRVEQLRFVRRVTKEVEGPLASAGAAAQVRWLAERFGGGAAAAAVEADGVLFELDSAPLVPRLLLGEQLAERGDDRAAAIARALLPERPVEANALLARWHARAGRHAEAVAALEQALVAYRRDAWPWPVLMKRTLRLTLEVGNEPVAAARLLRAVEEPFAVRLLERDRVLVRLGLAARAGGAACVAVLHELEPHPVWEEPFLRQRALCYAQAGDPLAARAQRDFERFVDHRPPSLREALDRAATAMTAGERR